MHKPLFYSNEHLSERIGNNTVGLVDKRFHVKTTNLGINNNSKSNNNNKRLGLYNRDSQQINLQARSKTKPLLGLIQAKLRWLLNNT